MIRTKCYRQWIALAGIGLMTSVLPGWAETAAPVHTDVKVTPAGAAIPFDQIEIRVGNEIITTMEIEEPLAMLRERAKVQFRGAELDAKMVAARKELIERSIENKLLLLEAREQKIEVPDSVVEEQSDKEIEKVRAQFPDSESFKEQLQSQHLTEVEFRKEREKIMKDDIMRQKLLQGKMQEFKTGAEISDEKLKEYYQKHGNEFKQSARVHLSQIFVARPDLSLAAEEFKRMDQLAHGKMKQAQQELRQGKEFAAVARQYSEHKLTAEKGGDIGWITEGDTGLPEFEKVVFQELQLNQVSGVIATGRGYFIVKMEDQQKGGVMAFEEARGRIRQVIMAEGSETRYNAWIESLKKKFSVTMAHTQTLAAETGEAKSEKAGEKK